MDNLKQKKEICPDDIIITWVRGYKQKMSKREVDKLVQRRKLENILSKPPIKPKKPTNLFPSVVADTGKDKESTLWKKIRSMTWKKEDAKKDDDVDNKDIPK